MLQKYNVMHLSRLSNILSQFGYKYPTAVTTFIFGSKEKIIKDLSILNKDCQTYPVMIKMLKETLATNIFEFEENEFSQIIFQVLKQYYPNEYNNLSDIFI